MWFSFYLALLWAAYAHAQIVTVLTSKTVTCTTNFGTTSVRPVPRTVIKTTIFDSTTIWSTVVTDTVFTTPETTVTTTVTDYETDTYYETSYTTTTFTTTESVPGCATTPPVKIQNEKRDAAFTTAPDGAVYRLYPTQIMCTKSFVILTETTSLVGAISTATADTTFTITQTAYDTEVTATTVTTTETATAYATVLVYPDCKPPANSTCSADVCTTFSDYICGSGYDAFGTASCDCGVDATGVGACFQNEYCVPYTPCVSDNDCPSAQGCWTNNCCGYSICAYYDECYPNYQQDSIPNGVNSGPLAPSGGGMRPKRV